MARAAAAVRDGARLVGTNDDPTYPTPQGLLPGAGSLLAAVSTAAEATARGGGQAPPAHRRTPSPPGCRPGELRVMVGDRPSTDGALAAQLGIPFALVLSGVTREGEVPADADAAAVAPDLATLVRRTLDGAVKSACYQLALEILLLHG